MPKSLLGNFLSFLNKKFEQFLRRLSNRTIYQSDLSNVKLWKKHFLHTRLWGELFNYKSAVKNVIKCQS